MRLPVDSGQGHLSSGRGHLSSGRWHLSSGQGHLSTRECEVSVVSGVGGRLGHRGFSRPRRIRHALGWGMAFRGWEGCSGRGLRSGVEDKGCQGLWFGEEEFLGFRVQCLGFGV